MVPHEERQRLITAARRRQPIEELERKWKKARGKHSNRYWTVEWLDLAAVRAELFIKWINGIEGD